MKKGEFNMSKVEQYVMAYRANHDKIKALLPEIYESLRPVLRINVEIIDDYESMIKIEFNTPVASKGKRGWLNLVTWNSFSEQISLSKRENKTEFIAGKDDKAFLDIEFIRTGEEGGCPKEDDNEGTFFGEIFSIDTGSSAVFKKAEQIYERKEYCQCRFEWIIPEYIMPSSVESLTAKEQTIKEAVRIKPEEMLGAYKVEFERKG